MYYYAPILFLAIKKEIGEQAMWQWLKEMVNSKAEVTDYTFLLTTFRKAVPDQNVAANIEAKYFTSQDALKNAQETLDVN